MGISELLLNLADPQAIKTLSFMEKMAAGLVVSFLGMGITFIALIILQLIIGLLARFAATGSREPLQKLAVDTAAAVDDTADQAEDEELVAVISAAIAMNMQPAGKRYYHSQHQKDQDSLPGLEQGRDPRSDEQQILTMGECI